MKVFSRISGMFVLVIFWVAFLFAGEFQLVRVSIQSEADIAAIAEMGIDLEGAVYKKNVFLEIPVSAAEKQRLQEAGFSVQTVIEDLEQFYASRLERRIGEGFGYGSMGGFYTYTEVVAQLDSMIAQYPNLISQKLQIGLSNLSRPIWAVKISDNPNVQENEPEVLFTALHHAREPQSMMTILYYMWYLLENYGTDPQVTYLVDNRQIWFVPVVNPDGYVHNQQTNPNGGGMWRLNGADNNDNGVYFESGIDGVDLNRNYGYQWGYNNIGSSPIPGDQTYRGPFAFSEPETRAIRDFCNQHQFRSAFNYHTYSDLLIYPWAYLDAPTPDHHIFLPYAIDMTQFNGYTYGTPGQTVGYSVNGDANDWMYGEQTTKPKVIAFTPEVGSSGDGFWPSTNRIIPLAEENLYPNLVLTYVAGGYPKLAGVGMDVYGQNPYLDPGEVMDLSPEIFNYGLENLSSTQLIVTASDPDIEFLSNPSIVLPALASFDTATVSTPITVRLSYNSQVGAEKKIYFSFVESGYTISTDSLTFRVGTPVVFFSDDAENGLSQWSQNGAWGITTSSYHSPNHSFTDSPYGNYGNNIDYWLRSQLIDLTGVTGATLHYWTHWDIENNWDFGTVEISTNNGVTWHNLRGQFMQAGSGQGVQQPNEWGYDGTQSGWVYETIDLSPYTGNQVRLRFRLRSDGAVTEDGWYVDDVEISTYGAGTSIPPYIASVTQLQQVTFTGNPYPVEAVVLDDQQIDHVSLFYRAAGDSQWVEVIMTGSGSLYTGSIPPLTIGTTVHYYVQAWDDQGNYSLYPYNAPYHPLEFTIISGQLPVVYLEPDSLSFTLPRFSHSVSGFYIHNQDSGDITFSITDTLLSAEQTATRTEPLKAMVQPLLRYLQSQMKNMKWETPPELPVPDAPEQQVETIVISDSVGDATNPGIDVVSLDVSTTILNYNFTINFAGPPDTNAIAFLPIDLDQNIATGIFPAPLGFGPGIFDLGSEYEIFVDIANLVGDSLGIPPSAYVFNTADTTLVGFPIPLIFGSNSVEIRLLQALYPVLDDNANMGLIVLNLRGDGPLDFAPDYGHGTLGQESGLSWLAEMDEQGQSSIPLTGTVAAGDSQFIQVLVATVQPEGTYQAQVRIGNSSGVNPLVLPVQVTISGLPQPDIDVSPLAVEDTLQTDSPPKSYVITVSNSGTGGLVYFVGDTVLNGDNWLQVNERLGRLESGATDSIHLTVEPAGLNPGELYQAVIRIFSNDPDEPALEIAVSIFIAFPTGIADGQNLPLTLRLHPNYPNPFNPETMIRFDLPSRQEITATIYNLLGQQVRLLKQGVLEAGRYELRWDGRNDAGQSVASGIYLFQLRTPGRILHRKMMLIR